MLIKISVKSEGPLNCCAFINSKRGQNTMTLHFWLPVTASLTKAQALKQSDFPSPIGMHTTQCHPATTAAQSAKL